MTVTVRTTRDPAEIEAARDLRVRVFVGEQGVDPSEELDDLDDVAMQIVAVDESAVLATCRLREIEDGVWKLERMAVEPRVRGLGVGGRLLSGAEREVHSRGARQMVTNAQRRAEGFYEAHGYRPEGGSFLDAGIEHVRMRKTL